MTFTESELALADELGLDLADLLDAPEESEQDAAPVPEEADA